VLQDELNRRVAQEFCLSLTRQVPDDKIKVIIHHVYCVQALFIPGWMEEHGGGGMTLFPVSTGVTNNSN